MRVIYVAFALCLLTASTVQAQHDGHVLVKPEQFWMPHTGDFADRPSSIAGDHVKIVKDGETFTLPADSTYDTIEVQGGGTLRSNPLINTTLRTGNLHILPGGVVDLSASCQTRLEVIIRDRPLNLDRDPFQFGTGILAYGKLKIAGCAMSKTFTQAAGDLRAGTEFIVLDGPVPSHWRVGDELIIPDTRQQPNAENGVTKFTPQREAPVTIKALAGNSLALSKPLDFDHLTIRHKDREILKPRVANVTRNVVVRSENPAGTLGHIAVLRGGNYDITYAELRDLGRTKNLDLDSTTLDLSHIGRQQTGRYTIHFHHVSGFGSKFIGNAVRGLRGAGKWGIVLHGDSDHTVQWNTVIDFDGSAIVTESGNETRNLITDNFMAYMGTAVTDVGQGILNSPQTNFTKCPGCDGAGPWLNGVAHSTIERNETWNSRFGAVLFPGGPADHYASVPGGPIDTWMGRPAAPWASFSDNVTVSNMVFGLDTWLMRGTVPWRPDLTAQAHVFTRHISANNAWMQTFLGSIPIASGGTKFVDSLLVCNAPVVGIFHGTPYTWLDYFVRTSVLGCNLGLDGGGGQNATIVDGGQWENDIDFHFNRPAEDAIPYRDSAVLITNTAHGSPGPGRVNLPLVWKNAVWDPSKATARGECVDPRYFDVNGVRHCLTGTGTSTPPPPPDPEPEPILACDNGLDDDGDGLFDGNDPGCEDAQDNDEFNAPPPPPPGAHLTLDVTTNAKSGAKTVTARWKDMDGVQVDLMRNGQRTTTGPNDGLHKYAARKQPVGTIDVYQVCGHDTPAGCTNPVTVTY